MKKLFPIILIVGGLAIAAIVWTGWQNVHRKTDIEYIQEGLLEQQRQAQQALETAAELSKKILTAPSSCAGLNTGFVYAICETEPYADEDWPDWTLTASPAEQTCILDTFHQTNAHAFAIKGKIYANDTPSTNRVANFISDICAASLFTDGVDYGETDKKVEMLISGFYADRATSSFKPRHEY